MLEDKILAGNNLFVATTGLSMRPFVRDGDKVIVKKQKAQDLRIGDIILYRDDINKRTICHRLVKRVKSQNRFILFARADAGGISGEPVLEGDLIGSVVGIVRCGKILNLRTKKQIVFNWFNAKFYGFFWMAFIYFKRVLAGLFNLSKKFSSNRKLS